MTVSSRTPEGLPSECPLCNAKTNVNFSDPADDAPVSYTHLTLPTIYAV